jgi:replicative DNA helicase
MCRRRSGEVPGFVYLGQAKSDPQWGLFRFVDDSKVVERNGNYVVDWNRRASELARDFTPERRLELSQILGLSEHVFSTLQIGYCPNESCFTFPEVSERGTVLGINRRFRDGRKKIMKGGHHGIIVPVCWKEMEGPIFVVEGPSDVLAMAALGLSALGRPFNTGGVYYLAEVLKNTDRQIVVVGENDEKANGQWPGKDGAKKTAEQLAQKLKRRILWTLPPDSAKDVRAWAGAKNLPVDGEGTMDDWHDAGEQLAVALVETAETVDPPAIVQEEPAKQSVYTFSAIDSAAFASGNYRPSWLIKRLLVKDQPAIVGGPKKSLKTSLLVDLAVSLGSGAPFLGEFTIYKKVRTVLLSGESGEHTLQETALRICAAKGVELASVDCLWDFRLPQLADLNDLAELKRGIKDHAIQVAIVDPLYLCLLAGAPDLQASNLFDMGPLLLRVARSCKEVGCTPVLIHHAKKNLAAGGHDPIDLEDLAFSGIQEFARQWLLVNRRERYEPGTGKHQLWLSVGGSIGHGGVWAVDIDEGVLDDAFGGRRWIVDVASANDAREAEEKTADNAKAEKQSQKDRVDDGKLLDALDNLDPERKGVSHTKARDNARLPNPRMNRAISRLVEQRLVEEIDLRITIGSKTTRTVKGVRRVPAEVPSGPSGQTPKTTGCTDGADHQYTIGLI